MAYRVELARPAVRAYEGLPAEVRGRVGRAIDRLAEDPRPKGRVKAIRGTRDRFYRYRVGDYRIVYDVLDAERVVLIAGIIHRGELEGWLRRR